ncbi:MAG: hypothetical protein ACOY90_13550 [Candidatus Zhuqueibacterota bacterium]
MRRTIFFILAVLVVLAGLYLLIWKVVDWQKVLIGFAALFPFGHGLHKRLAGIDAEIARRKKEESSYQAKMATQRETLQWQINQLEKSIQIIEKKYELLEKQRSTIREAIEQMPREKQVELFREAFGK